MAGLENSGAQNVELLIGEPLDTLQIRISGRNGVNRNVPALHIGFMETRAYVYFKLVPVRTDDDEDKLTAEEEEWLECMSFLEDDLHWLLRLPHHRFWSQVVYDEELHKCLESYLTLAPRDYDVINMKMKKDIQATLQKIHRLVFLVFLRMSTYKESKEHHIRPEAYGDIIYDNYVFDVPKLMELCVLYGFQNKAIITKMTKNIFTTQPKYFEDLNDACNCALTAFNFAEEKLFLNVPEKHGGCRKLEDNTPSGIKEMPLASFLDVIAYIADSSATIYMFLDIYPSACEVFRQKGAITRIASFYEQTFPAVEKKVKILVKENTDSCMLEAIKKKTILSKTFLIKTFRNILSYCCIQYILDSKNSLAHLSNISPAEDFIDIFTEITFERTYTSSDSYSFLHDYNVLFPLENDIELINEVGACLDPERLSYVFGSIHDTLGPSQIFTSTAENGARPKTLSKNVLPSDESVKSLQGVAAILKPKPQGVFQNGTSSTISDDSQPSEFQMDSLIHSVLDVLPNLGEGFIEECLGYFGYDSEKIIDAILTESLPPCLSKLDRHMGRKHKGLKSTSENNEIISNVPSVLSERQNIYDNDEFDVFSRTDINMENIHIGKKNKTPSSYQSLQNEKESEFLKKFICTFGDQESDDDERDLSRLNLYEDEYDDTYDSTLVGVKEPSLENEPDKEEPSEEPKYEDVREPQPDDFCFDPAKLREINEQRRQAKYAARNRGGGPPPSNTNNRQNKERNKAYSANHSRRKQSDYKKSRGMMPFPTR